MDSGVRRASVLLHQLQQPSFPDVLEAKAVAAAADDGYRFTLPNAVLTKEQRDFYETNGFLLLKRLVPLEKLQMYTEHFRRLCNGEVERPPTMTLMRDVTLAKQKELKGEHVITKAQDYEDDPVLFDFCKLPQILDVVAAFTGPNIMTTHTMLIHKPPDVGGSSRHPMHQDLWYFPFRPTDRIVCAWTAMERIDRQNGCLSVVPGTHKGELFKHEYPKWNGKVNKAYHGILDYKPPESRVHLIMDAGDTVFFHPLLIHGSGENRTKGYRKAISCHYSTADYHFIDVEKTIQKDIAKEIEDVAAMKRGIIIKYEDYWRFKFRVVRGKAAE